MPIRKWGVNEMAKIILILFAPIHSFKLSQRIFHLLTYLKTHNIHHTSYPSNCLQNTHLLSMPSSSLLALTPPSLKSITQPPSSSLSPSTPYLTNLGNHDAFGSPPVSANLVIHPCTSRAMVSFTRGVSPFQNVYFVSCECTPGGMLKMYSYVRFVYAWVRGLTLQVIKVSLVNRERRPAGLL